MSVVRRQRVIERLSRDTPANALSSAWAMGDCPRGWPTTGGLASLLVATERSRPAPSTRPAEIPNSPAQNDAQAVEYNVDHSEDATVPL